MGLVRERIEQLARAFEMPGGRAKVGAPLDAELRFRGEPDAELAFLVMLSALRFGSGYHDKLRKRPGLSVGQTLVKSLTELFERLGAPASEDLLQVTSADCARWLGQDLGESAPIELMDLFARSFRDLGRLVTDQYDGSFVDLVHSAGGSVERLVEVLAQMPFYADVQRYRGLDVPFYLRAQQLAIELAQTFGPSGFGRFDDLQLLAPSADNVIPHVLRLEGVVRYERGLQERIDRGEPVPAHTEREVEIRAAAVFAVELIVEALRTNGVAATDVQVDSWLRARGRAPAYRSKPRHRSRTVLY
ncbi:MAG: hypothetical protein JNL28_09380 [Planctomycetes bacterium]|nr:hypothetical protein [Planctomycetota bacterium]